MVAFARWLGADCACKTGSRLRDMVKAPKKRPRECREMNLHVSFIEASASHTATTKTSCIDEVLLNPREARRKHGFRAIRNLKSTLRKPEVFIQNEPNLVRIGLDRGCVERHGWVPITN